MNMKRSFRRGVVILTALALLLAAPPSSLGGSVLQEAQQPAAESASTADGEAALVGSDAPLAGFEAGKKKLETEFKSLFTHPKATLERWALKDGPVILGRLGLFFLILLVAKVLAAFAGRVVRKAVSKSNKRASELFKTFIENTVSKVVFFIGLVLALQNIGLDVAPLLAGIGVFGFIVGFALQDTLGNFAAGMMLLLYRPFDVGHFVEIAGQEGTVEAMTLVSTTLLTLDNQRLTIPNGKIWGDVIRNATANERRRINEIVGIGYDDDIPKAEAIAMEVASALTHVFDDPEPQVLVVGLGDSSVNLSVRAWVPTAEYFGSCCELRRSLKMRFDEEGITIPYPQADVHVREYGPREVAVNPG